MSTPTVLVHRDPAELSAAVAARLITRLADVQSARSAASLVMTGGSIAGAHVAPVRGCEGPFGTSWSPDRYANRLPR